MAATASKANAGGLSGYLLVILLWAVTTIPGWERVPDEPKLAILGIITYLVGFLTVYYAPPNQTTYPGGGLVREGVPPVHSVSGLGEQTVDVAMFPPANG